jgi:hypothetical protein
MREPIMQAEATTISTRSCRPARRKAQDGMLERALAAVTIPAGPLTIADFGSSQGHNSMRQIALMLDRLTERIGRERDVRVVHTDLPHCDYTSLFVTLESSSESYRRGRPYAFASAIGHSFYDRLLPAGSLTLGWSAALNERPSDASARAHWAGPSLLG